MQISCQKWHTDKMSCTDKMAEKLTKWQDFLKNFKNSQLIDNQALT